MSINSKSFVWNPCHTATRPLRKAPSSALLLLLAACGQRYDLGTVLPELPADDPARDPIGWDEPGAADDDHSTNAIATLLVDDDADADAIVVPAASGSASATARLGDVDADGYDDWMTADHHLVYGGPRPADDLVHLSGAQATQIVWPADLTNHRRYATAAGDVDGDGCADVLFSLELEEGSAQATAPRAFLWYGSEQRPTGDVAIEAVAVDVADVLRGALAPSGARERSLVLTGIGDLDGDGHADFTATSAFGFEGAEGAGSVIHLFYGGAETLAPAARFVDTHDRRVWPSVNPLGDVDADGNSDIIISPGPQAYLLHGTSERLRGDLSLASTGEAISGFPSFASAEALGDLDADGYDDFVVGAIEEKDGATDTVYSLFYGNPDRASIGLDREQADAIIIGPTGRAFVQPLGDWDGNGLADLGLTIEVQAGEQHDFRSSVNPSTPSHNEYHLIAGRPQRFSGEYTAPAYRADLPRRGLDANGQLLGEDPPQLLSSPMPLGDIDADGHTDLAFSVTYNPTGQHVSWIKYGAPVGSVIPSLH